MFSATAFPALASQAPTRSVLKPASSFAQAAKPSATQSATQSTTQAAHAKPSATQSAKPASYASASASAATAKPKNPINWSKENTQTCWFVLRGLPCPYKSKCAFSHKETTRSLAGLEYRKAFGVALEKGWIDFQSIFEEVYNALRKGIKDLRIIHGIWLDESVAKYSFLLNINLLILIENEEIEPCHFDDLVKMWFAAACIGRKQGYNRFMLFEHEDGELENNVWELGRRLQTCNKDADFERYQTCYGPITAAIHALKVPTTIRDKHARFFTISKKSICDFGINCNNGAHRVHKVDTRRLTGQRVREEDDVEPTSACMDLATVDFRFPKREAQHATATPMKVVSARAKLDAETDAYTRDLTQLVQNEARISELVPDVPAEVAALRAKQAQLDSTRTALSKATHKKADLDADVSKIENGVTGLATLLAEIEKKQRDAIGGPYVLSQKEVRNIIALEKLTKNRATRIAKFKADSSVQADLIEHLTAIKTAQEA
jgi:hypothetical protein